MERFLHQPKRDGHVLIYRPLLIHNAMLNLDDVCRLASIGFSPVRCPETEKVSTPEMDGHVLIRGPLLIHNAILNLDVV